MTTTWRAWYIRFLYVVAPASIIYGVYGWFTSKDFWNSTYRVFMGIVFAFLIKRRLDEQKISDENQSSEQ